LGVPSGVFLIGSLLPTWVRPSMIGFEPSGLRFASDPVPCVLPEKSAR
jgi:hypothetical protein